jgi:hypothetical protein
MFIVTCHFCDEEQSEYFLSSLELCRCRDCGSICEAIRDRETRLPLNVLTSERGRDLAARLGFNAKDFSKLQNVN